MPQDRPDPLNTPHNSNALTTDHQEATRWIQAKVVDVRDDGHYVAITRCCGNWDVFSV